MAVKQGVVDFRGRLVDVGAYRFANNFTPAVQALATTDSGQLVTGISKLVQRVLLELLTDKGSMTYLPDRGTLFMLSLRSGIIRTSGELFAAFSSAATDVIRQLRLEDRSTDAPDERVSTITMISASLSGGSAVVKAAVTSIAGDSRDIYIPLSVSATPPVLGS